MPELPEVEIVCQELMRVLPGRQIKRVDILRSNSIGYPQPASFSANLVGHCFVKVSRRGKVLLFQLNRGASLVVHLRMSGRLLIKDSKSVKGPHLRVRILLDDGKEIHFEDMRVFGRLWYIPKDQRQDEIVPSLKKLGMEPLLKLTGPALQKGFAGRRQCIKTALLDQHVVAGLGNIYADEALFKAKVNPTTSISELSIGDWHRLAKAIKDVLQVSLKMGGTTIRDYSDANGVNGRYQHYSWVYGRAGQICRVCQGKINKIKLTGRSTHFCLCCQPLRQGKMAKTGSK